jgi:hypothetical protein
MSEPSQPRRRTNPREPRDPYAAEGIEPPPENVAEALKRARLHGRAAAAESFAAVRALIDAAALTSGGRASDASRLLGPIAKLFESLGNDLGSNAIDGSTRVLESIASAIDDEIAVWDERARTDTEARTVLRAFLGLREVLWEFGVRRAGPTPGRGAADKGQPGARPRTETRNRTTRTTRTTRPRIQRVPVQG